VLTSTIRSGIYKHRYNTRVSPTTSTVCVCVMRCLVVVIICAIWSVAVTGALVPMVLNSENPLPSPLLTNVPSETHVCGTVHAIQKTCVRVGIVCACEYVYVWMSKTCVRVGIVCACEYVYVCGCHWRQRTLSTHPPSHTHTHTHTHSYFPVSIVCVSTTLQEELVTWWYKCRD
jgi:hypothetical protein